MKRCACSLVLLLLLSCSSRVNFLRQLADAEKKFKDNTGFMLYDPATKKTIAEYNADRYFIPASNTKILTFYTALKILGDSVPAVRYVIRHDSLIFWGTGDPSFLNKNVLLSDRAYSFLQNSPQRLFVSVSNFKTDAWGPGWAWDDFAFSYSAERSSFPIYGNVQQIKKTANKFSWSPRFFQNHFAIGDTLSGDSKLSREFDSNQILFNPGRKSADIKSWEIPFRCSSDALAEMLSDTLKRQVDEIALPLPHISKSIAGIPADSLYSVMMKTSDNFIAEQLLLLCAQKISDTLDTQIAIRYAQKNIMTGLPDELIWVDGSGLSRYNLATPRSFVSVWEKMYTEFPKSRLFPLLATGGQKGTLKNYYATTPPFIFGKTGSLSNNAALSGYLVTKKGKVLIFSFMNGNFAVPGRDVRSMMERILTAVRDNY